MKESSHYDKEFFTELQDGSYISARNLLPLVRDIFSPKSVIDIGCGVGFWLKVWKEDLDVDTIKGIEGPYLTPDLLKIPPEFVEFRDLKEDLVLDKRYDLAMSLEVGEHLPDSHAEKFVKHLVNASDVVLFSAAIVGQLGTFHINEQMPEYWAAHFAKFDYVPVDYLRSRIWNNEKIEYWYRQNVLLFIKRSRVKDFPVLLPYFETTSADCLLRIHPKQYALKLELIRKTSTLIGLVRWKLYPIKRYFKKHF